MCLLYIVPQTCSVGCGSLWNRGNYSCDTIFTICAHLPDFIYCCIKCYENTSGNCYKIWFCNSNSEIQYEVERYAMLNKMVENVRIDLDSLDNGEFSKKMNCVLNRNKGYAVLKKISNVIQGAVMAKTDLAELKDMYTLAEISAFWFAPVSSASYEFETTCRLDRQDAMRMFWSTTTRKVM